MAKKILLASGCSYTDKNYRSTTNPDIDVNWPMWPELLARSFNMSCINLGKSGAGNGYIYSSLLDNILRRKDKSQIGLVVAGWSQCTRDDWQYSTTASNTRWVTNLNYEKGDIAGWVRKSLRNYMSLQIVCEHYKIPLLQTQLISMYANYINDKGLNPDGTIRKHASMFQEPEWKRVGFSWSSEHDDLLYSTTDYHPLEKGVFKAILEYDDIINYNTFIGWPIAEKLGGYTMNVKACGTLNDRVPDDYYISREDGHPNARGQERIANFLEKEVEKIYGNRLG